MNPGAPENPELRALRAEVSALEEACEEGRRVTEALSYVEQRLLAIQEATRNGVVILEKGVILEVNPRFAAMYGYAPEEYRGMVVRTLIALESSELVLAHIRAGSEESYEAICLRKDGARFPVEVRA